MLLLQKMKSFLKAFSLPGRDERRLERIWCAAILLFVVSGLVIPTGFAEAQPLKLTVNWIMVTFASVLNWIINFLANLLIMVTDVLIQVAQFNHFVDSQPVQAGWPLIRDVTNMFFIVILLVTAFSTIVRWEKFNYKKILPKLLLMTILVNFSLTLIGILIDFSQVIMLTFVNGFKAAAAGNIVSLFHLDKIMKIESTTASEITEQQEPQLVHLVAAEMLALFFLGLAFTMLVIMLIYLLVRIVGLWITLIFSPAALLMTALANTSISKHISGLSQDYWDRLGALLSGGPIMAFFLWLTLAMAQNSTAQNSGFGRFTSSDFAGSAEVGKVQNYFESAISNVEDVATFFVAIIMLGMGLSMAVSISGQISQGLGNITGKIKSAGVGASKFLAYGGALAAGAAAGRAGAAVGRAGYRGGRYVAGAAATAIDRRAGITQAVGRNIQRVGLATGITGLATAGARIAATRQRAIAAEAERFKEATAGLGAAAVHEQALRYERSRNRDRAAMGKEKVVRFGVTKEGFEEHMKQYEEAGRELNLSGDELEAYKTNQASKDMARRLDEYKEMASASGNDEDKKWVAEQLEKHPEFAKNPSEYVAEQMGKDTRFHQKMQAEALLNTDVLRSVIVNSGDLQGNLISKDSTLEKLSKGTGARAKAINQFLEEVDEQRGNMTREQFLKNAEAVQAAGLAGGQFVRGKEAKDPLKFVPASVLAAEARPAETHVRRDEREIDAAGAQLREHRAELDRLRTEREQGETAGGYRTADTTQREMDLVQAGVRDSQIDMMRAGAQLERVYEVDPDGTFKNDEDRQNFVANVRTIHQQGDTDVSVYENLDLTMLEAKGKRGTGNEVRKRFVQNTSVDQLQSVHDRARADENESALENVAQMVRAVDTEASGVNRQIENYNADLQAAREKAEEEGKRPPRRTEIDRNRILELAEQYQGAASVEARERAVAALQEAVRGKKGVRIDMDDAVAMLKREQIGDSETLRNYTRHPSVRFRQAVGDRGAQAAAPPPPPAAQDIPDLNVPPPPRTPRRRQGGGAGGGGAAPPPPAAQDIPDLDVPSGNS